MGMSAAQNAAGGQPLNAEQRAALYVQLVARTGLVILFFSYNILFFYPFSGLMGVVGMAMAAPQLLRAWSDRWAHGCCGDGDGSPTATAGME